MYEQGKNGKNHAVNGTYPHFSLGLKLTEEQKNFFDTYGFLHFKNFVDGETVKAMLAESVRIQNE